MREAEGTYWVHAVVTARDENKGLQWPPRNENKPQEPVSVQAESAANEDLFNL